MPDSNPFLDPELDVYITETPYGSAHAIFKADDEDGSGVRFDEGEWPASGFMLDRINETTGPDGIRLDAATITGELYHDFCQPEGSGVTIHRPAYLEPEADGEPEESEISFDSAFGVDLGPVFTEYQGNPKGAIDRLLRERTGDARAVWTRADLGSIDLIYGNQKTGLAKIARKHPEMIAKLPALLRDGRLVRKPGGRKVFLVGGGEPPTVAVIALDWYGAAKTWVVTSYEDVQGAFTGGLKTMNTETLDSALVEILSAGQRTQETIVADYKNVKFDAAEDTNQSISDLRNEISNASGSLAKLAAARRLLQVITERADDDSDDPNSPNYRYRDTGVIDGARKMEVTDAFREAVRKGQLMRWQTIDWDAVEANPRRAKELITKSNLFGKVDWDGLKTEGMDPGAAFLVDRIYASIGKEPPEDSAISRKDFARGIESLRERMETCKTPDQVQQTLKEMREEWKGVILTASESDAYQAAVEEARAIREKHKPLKSEYEALKKRFVSAKTDVSIIKNEREKRERRKWKPDPELEARYQAAKALQDAVEAEYSAFHAAHPEITKTKTRQLAGGWSRYTTDVEEEERQAWDRANHIKKHAEAKNLIDNPTTRAWIALGERFHGILSGKSEAFAGHRANVRAGNVTDWSWAEKGSAQPKTTKRAAQFQIKVVDQIERIGGAPVNVESTQALKERFGLRDVQSGNWVLKDPQSAKWHVEQSAGAFMDLSDLLGVDAGTVAMNGKLALALGARGKGNTGFGGAARAHYEPIGRVINITKMRGGGSLAHEWFHALDNLVSEAHGIDAGADTFASEDPAVRTAMPPALATAWSELHDAMLAGTLRQTRTVEINQRARDMARLNLRAKNVQRGMPEQIKKAGSLEAAVAVVDQAELANAERAARYGKKPTKKDRDRYEDWRQIAIAHYTPEDQSEARIAFGPPMSSFALEANKLDGGKKSYWATPREMAARAFQAWCEDRLTDQSRRNDYLSAMADNKFYIDPLFGQQKPFPEGDERERINQAFDRLVAAMRDHGTLKAVMDAVFGDGAQAPAWWETDILSDQI